MQQRLRKFRAWSRDFERRRFPKGAILFPTKVLQGIDWKEVDSFRNQFNVDKILLIHGVAFRRGNAASIVSGPAGIRKSTNLRQAARAGNAVPIDDGLILVGRNQGTGQYLVFESGRYEIDSSRARAAKFFRELSMGKSPFLKERISDRKFASALAIEKVTGGLGAFFGRFLARNLSNKKHAPKAFALTKLLWVSHPREPFGARCLVGHDMTRHGLGPIKKELGQQVAISSMASTRKGFQRKLSDFFKGRQNQ